MTHSELVERAVLWLQGKGGCTFAFSEFSTTAWETPDAMGFTSWHSVVVECKVTRADFLKDRKKPFRRRPEMGMGAERYFMVPAHLVSVDEVSAKWGLLYVHNRHVKVVKKSEGFAAKSYRAEFGYLVSMLRRIEIRAIANHYASGETTRPSDFLNQWIKRDPQTARTSLASSRRTANAAGNRPEDAGGGE